MSLPFRNNVVSVIINKENKILAVKVNPSEKHPAAKVFGKFSENHWVIPQGGTDGQEVLDAAKREVYEETGIKNIEFIKISSHKNIYSWSSFRSLWSSRRYQFRGQSQSIVYFKFFGTDNEIKVDNYELVDYRWVELEHLADFLHSSRLPLVNIMKEDLKHFA